MSDKWRRLDSRGPPIMPPVPPRAGIATVAGRHVVRCFCYFANRTRVCSNLIEVVAYSTVLHAQGTIGHAFSSESRPTCTSQVLASRPPARHFLCTSTS